MKPADFLKAAFREGSIMLAGAIIAAAVIGEMPALREWLKKRWDGAPGGIQ